MRGAPKHFLHHSILTLGGASIVCNFPRISEDRLLYASPYSLSKASERHFQKCSNLLNRSHKLKNGNQVISYISINCIFKRNLWKGKGSIYPYQLQFCKLLQKMKEPPLVILNQPTYQYQYSLFQEILMIRRGFLGINSYKTNIFKVNGHRA